MRFTLNRPRFLVLTTLLLLCGGHAAGTVYYSKKEAMELAFGKQAEIEMLPLFLSETEKAAIEGLARARLDSSLFTFYVGKRGESLLGYAAIETHTVRTKPETVLVVLTPAGELRSIEVLAFHEPPEYQPPARWFAQLNHQPLEELDFNTGIQAITGATLSSRAALKSVRKVLAVYRIMIGGQKD